MKLTILGSGTAVIRKKRKSACYLLELNQKLILLDCGTGIFNIPRTQYDVQKIDHIFISHPHVDHLGGLINVLQSMLVSGMYYPSTKRKKTLYLHGYQGFRRDYETLRNILFPEREEPYSIKVFEYGDAKDSTRLSAKNLSATSFGGSIITQKFDDFILKTTAIQHNPHLFQARSYRIEANGKSLVYGGDCGFDERLITLSRNADVALYEMSHSPAKFKKHGPVSNHLSPLECGLIAAKAEVKKLVLVHWYDDTPKGVIIEEVQKNFHGEILIPDDLDLIKI